MPVIHRLAGPEDGHKLAIKALQMPLRPKETREDAENLQCEVSEISMLEAEKSD